MHEVNYSEVETSLTYYLVLHVHSGVISNCFKFVHLSLLSSLSVIKIFQTGNLEAITIVKQEVTFEIQKNRRVCT